MLLRSAFLALLAIAVCAAPARAGHGAQVRLADCDPTARTAVFEGSMDASPSTLRMQMRFTLQVATEGHRSWSRLPAPGLDRWRTANPGADRYVHTRRVQGLLGPARYRMVVRFRWLDAAGHLLARERRVSPSCRQDRAPMLLQ